MSAPSRHNKENVRLLDMSSDEESEDFQLEIIPGRKRKITRRDRSGALATESEPNMHNKVRCARWPVNRTLLLWMIMLTWICVALYELIEFNTGVRIVHKGPKYPPTKGEVWPKPQHQEKGESFYVIENYDAFSVTISHYNCEIVDQAVLRLLRNTLNVKFSLVRRMPNESNETQPSHCNDVKFVGTYTNKTEFRIELTKACEKYPHLDMDESYILNVKQNVVLSSASVWGILRGLETFNHLLYFSDSYSEIRVNATKISDFPAYTHRGLLVDTGRHYLKLSTLHSLIDAMEMNKMNVLHWHIVDDESFPYQSERFLNLSKKGAFHPALVYTKAGIQKLIEHGRLAGIRVIPEFDIPGHVRSWGEAYPDILTQCYGKDQVVGLGPLDPTKSETYRLLKLLFAEVKRWFPDEYIHLGGDEVDFGCWQSNPRMKLFMKKNQLTVKQLQTLFTSKLIAQLPSETPLMVWQDAFDIGASLPNKTIVQVWRYQWIQEMVKVLEAGHRVVFSSSWYLDYLDQGWDTFYEADPRRMVYSNNNNEQSLKDVVGGEACMWGEKADDNNIISRIWPRTSAVAERLWTGTDYKSSLPADPVTDEVRSRIEEHSCRMIQRGVKAESPNGPGFCVESSDDYYYTLMIHY